MGIGQDLSSVIFADGVNEAGFAAAALYFPGYADYDSDKTDDGADTRVPVAAIEIVRFLLGLCASLDQAASLLRTVHRRGGLCHRDGGAPALDDRGRQRKFHGH